MAKDITLTADLKAKLNGFMAFELKAPFKYIPKVFRDPKNEIPKSFWPTFILTSKSGTELAEIEDMSGYMVLNQDTGKTEMHLQSGKLRVVTLERGICEVKNYIMEDGSKLDFNKDTNIVKITTQDGRSNVLKGKSVDYIIERMPIALQMELQDAINDRKTLSDEELLSLE